MKNYDLAEYEAIIFDCDGVLLDSNKVKTRAFYLAALHHGERQAQELVEYHKVNGGVSRYKKFRYFLDHIVGKFDATELEVLLDKYAHYVKDGLLSCRIAPKLRMLREQTKESKWMIVSGGDQGELRQVFKQRSLCDLFDAGIYGSPDSKEIILAREIDSSKQSTVFLGDSKYDFAAANSAELDFIFISDWSEVAEWEKWVAANAIKYVHKLSDLLT